MSQLFSRRISPQPDAYRYDIPDKVRWRILHTMKEISDYWPNSFDLGEMFGEVQNKLLRQYGGLYRPAYDAACVHDDPLLNHFLCCSDEMALDFVELCFQTRTGCGRQDGVLALNSIFQEEALGYELTAWREIETDEPAELFGHTIGDGKSYRIEFPRIIRKDEQFTHTEIVQPCLTILGHPKLVTANAEMLAVVRISVRERFENDLRSPRMGLQPRQRHLLKAGEHFSGQRLVSIVLFTDF